MSAALAADDEAQALPLLPRDVDAMLGIGTAHQALPVHVPARSLEAGAEAATLTEPEASPGRAAPSSSQAGLFQGSVSCARMSSRDGAHLGLHLGYTGFFTVIKEDVQRREYTVLLRDRSGNDIGTSAWRFHESPAAAETRGKGGERSRLTESRRGWFPKSHCQEHPALPVDLARKAAKSFDGSDYGSDYLNFLEGAPILRVDHQEETELWAFGVLLDHAAEGKRPVSGWFPASYWGDLAECSSGVLQASRDFDAREYGSAYLSFCHGDVLVPMRHSEADGAWSFGALLLDTESLIFSRAAPASSSTAKHALPSEPQERPATRPLDSLPGEPQDPIGHPGKAVEAFAPQGSLLTAALGAALHATPARIGIDVGGVLKKYLDDAPGRPWEFRRDAEVPGAMRALGRCVRHFGAANVFTLSKCSGVMRHKTRTWLVQTMDVCGLQIGMRMENLLYSRERSGHKGKGEVAEPLQLSHFVDDQDECLWSVYVEGRSQPYVEFHDGRLFHMTRGGDGRRPPWPKRWPAEERPPCVKAVCNWNEVLWHLGLGID